MAERIWQTTKECFCEHVMRVVSLDAEMIYPIDVLPDPPRVRSHRCSLGMECNQSSKWSCVWAGTNPNFDPYMQ
jgi:hypothetical protein